MKAAAASAGSKAANVAGTVKRSLSFSKRKAKQRLEEDSEDGRGDSPDFAQSALAEGRQPGRVRGDGGPLGSGPLRAQELGRESSDEEEDSDSGSSEDE